MRHVAQLVAGILLAGCADATYQVDRTNTSYTYDGVGGLSGGGATSRLLVDYPQEQRDQILDYLFTPNFGASLQILKVEIGGDSQSTDGTETSHMHTKDDLDVTRGYEWWLMKEAKKRNPDIKLYGLPWAFPGWVGNDPTTGVPSGSPFTYPNQTSHYIMEWIKGAKNTWNLDIDYIGIWNERASSASYAKSLKDTLNNAGFGNIKLVAKDGGADICKDLAQNATYAKAIDIVGLHYPSDYNPNGYQTCHSLNKPLWASEESSSYDDYNGAACWARVLHSHFVLSGITSSIMWNLVGSYYHGTNWYASSMMTAVQPWSGYWENTEVVWATAHLTQFTKIGWKYLSIGSGSGQLDKGGFYTTIVDPDTGDFSIFVVKISHEHAPCTRPGLPAFNVEQEMATFQLAADMRGSSLAVWRSNYEDATKVQFEQLPEININADGTFTLNVTVGDYYTVSTIKTGKKGQYTTPPSQPRFPLPFKSDFDSIQTGQEEKWFADQIGAWEVHPDNQNSSNKVTRQMVPQLPIGWSDHGSNGPMTLIGMKEWQDILVAVDFRLPVKNASACVATRVNQMWHNGVVVCVASDGSWNLTYSGPPQNGQFVSPPVASGKLDPLQLNTWHRLGLQTVNDTATAWFDGAQFLKKTIRNIDTGFAALGMNEWYQVEFDNFELQQAGSNWQPKGGNTPTAGQEVIVTPCQPNGVTKSCQMFDITSDWQIIHKGSGLCVTAASATQGAKLTLETCSLTNKLQAFVNDYTRIRNTNRPLTLQGTSQVLVGAKSGQVSIGASAPAQGWNSWSYYPNTFQLRNTYDTNTHLGYPMCLAACQQ